MNNPVAVVDFGSEKIRVLVGKRGVNETFDVLGTGYVDYAGFFEGEFLEPENLKLDLSIAIDNAEKNSGIKIQSVYVGVPAEFSFVNCVSGSINLAKRRRVSDVDITKFVSQIKDANHVEGHTIIDYSPIYYVLDNNAKSLNPVGLATAVLGANVCLVYAEDSFINAITDITRDLDLRSIDFISTPLATAKYLCHEDIKRNYAIIIDCGHITTSVSLLRGDGLLNMYSFSMGGGSITADLSECLKLPYSSADELKRKIILSIDPKDNSVYETTVEGSKVNVSANTSNEIVRCRIESIAGAIKKCIDSFTFECPNYTPIYLTGGGLSYIKGAKDYLSKILGKNVDMLIPNEPELNKPHFATILGLLASACDRLGEEKGFKKFINNIKSLFKK